MSEHEIVLARGLHLPRNATTQKFAFIARSGAGKTYAAGRLAEQLVGAHAQLVVLDPVGSWYGLRLNSEGTGPGLSIPVFGGHHADIDIQPGMGAAVAKILVSEKFNAVLDVSLMRKGQRKQFVTDFAEEFFALKKLSKGPVHVMIEEAHVFVPQRTEKGEERMLGAFEDLCRLGRNYGIGYSLISQRPQSIHKDVLNQIECLVALQTTGTHERKALKEWIVTQGLTEKITDELPKLEIGEAYVWSPQWLKVLGKYKILKKNTYDASATPEYDEASREEKDFAKVDLDKIRNAMAEVAVEIVKDDPKLLRKEIYDLKKQITILQADLAARDNQPLRQVPVIHEEDVALIRRVEKLMGAVVTRIESVEQRPEVPQQGASRKIRRVVRAQKPTEGKELAVQRKERNNELERDDGKKLKKGAREMLRAMVLFKGVMTRRQIAMQTGIKSKGSTFTSYLSSLRQSGFVEERGTGLDITDAGRDYLRSIGEYPTTALTHEEIVAHWMPRFKKGAREMLEYLIRQYPRSVHREELGNVVGIDHQGSTFTSYLSSLSGAEVAVKDYDGTIKASPELWPQEVHV